MTRQQRNRMNELLSVYLGWDIQERKPNRWAAVDRHENRVIHGTHADTLAECEARTLLVAEQTAARISERFAAKQLV